MAAKKAYIPPFFLYLSSSSLIALRELATFETFNLPKAYSFCASMMMSAESLGEAVELGTPRMSARKDTGPEAIVLCTN